MHWSGSATKISILGMMTMMITMTTMTYVGRGGKSTGAICHRDQYTGDDDDDDDNELNAENELQ